MAETLLFDYNRQYQVDTKIVRIFNTYGPKMNQNDGRVVSNFIVQALNNTDITIYGDGNQTRSFCYVDDMVDGESRLSFLLEPKGNLESCFRITRLRQEHYLLDSAPGHGPLLLESLERFKLRSKIEFVLHDWQMVSILCDYEMSAASSAFLSV